MVDEKVESDFSRMFSETRIIDLKASSKNEALIELIEIICKADEVTDCEEFKEAIFEREKQLSTGVGIGVAIPHVKISSVKNFVAAIGRSHRGIDYSAIDNKPVHIIVMIGASDTQSGEYLKILAKLVLRLKEKEFRRKVMLAKNSAEIKELFLNNVYGDN